jgi:hypothetical protein
MSNSASSADITTTTIGSLAIDPRVPIHLPLNYDLSQPLTYEEQQAQISIYLALHREYRQFVRKPAFRKILRILLRTRALAQPSAAAKTGADLDKIREYWDTLSEDAVFNKAMAVANLEIILLNRGRIAKLTEFATIVIEHVLDHEYYPEFWPLDSESLAHFKPPYMYKGREYSAEESRKIHADMSAGEIQDRIAKTCSAIRKIVKVVPSDSFDEIQRIETEHVKDRFKIEDAFQRYERLELEAKYLAIDGLKVGSWYRVNYNLTDGETLTRVAEFKGVVRENLAAFLTQDREVLAMRPSQICGSGTHRVLDATPEDMKDLLEE